MIRWLWFAVVSLWFLHGSRGEAHDLGFRTVVFQELENARYQLKYIARPGSVESQAPPGLSERLTWEQEPGLPDGLMRLVFEVDGRSLSNEDRILLPWKSNGIIVEAFWRNGESVRRVMYYDERKGGFEIRIGDLRAGGGALSETAGRFAGMGLRHLVTGVGHLLCVIGLLVLGERREMRTCGAFAIGLAVASIVIWLTRCNVKPAMADTMAAVTLVLTGGGVVRQFRGDAADFGILAAVAFGAVHGVGFSGALADLDLPKQGFPLGEGAFLLGGIAGIFAIGCGWMLLVRAAAAISLAVPRRLVWLAGYAVGIGATMWSFAELKMWFS